MPATKTSQPTLVIFCRRPAVGIGKQRLAAETGPEMAQRCGELLLGCALEDGLAWPGGLVLSPADAADASWAGSLLPRAMQVVAQPGGNLGERLNAVDHALRQAGHTALTYVGSDAPGLGSRDYAAAAAALDGSDAVFSPALDGGVTLMAARRAWPPLAGLPWSSAALYRELRAVCDGAGWLTQEIAAHRDIDVAADLPPLCADLARDERPARQALYRWLRGLGYCGGNSQASRP
jgi:hypothetical protein